MGSSLAIKPQPGPQEEFSRCSADIAIYGGSAGGGKTYALLMEAARWFQVRNYRAVLFRRTLEDVKKAGGLWDKGSALYRQLKAQIREGGERDAQWPEYNSKIQFRGCEFEDDVFSWQGAELDFVGIDEISHFTAKQIWYLWTRCRSTTGIKPYLRGTCNPEPDSHIRELIDWWIDPGSGFVIEERSGVIRWIVRTKDDEIRNFATQQDAQLYLNEIGDQDQSPVSLTFIRSRLEDNPALLRADPKYKSRLAMQDAVTRAKLLDGNWNARATAGALFSRGWFKAVETFPDVKDVQLWVRGWDFAFSRPTPQYPNPDWSATVLIAWLKTGKLCFCHVDRIQQEQGGVDEWIRAIVQNDGPRVIQALWQDPASGKALAQHQREVIRTAMPSSEVLIEVERLDKIAYASILSAAIDPRTRNNQYIAHFVDGPGVQPFFAELEGFPKKGGKKDQVDAASRAYLVIDQHLNGFAAGFLRAWTRAEVY